MKIKFVKGELMLLSQHSAYIKSCCKNVRTVFCDTVYFQNDYKDYGASWYYSCGGCEDPKIIVQQLNGLLGTEFELEQ